MKIVDKVTEQDFFSRKLKDEVKDYNQRCDQHAKEIEAIEAEEIELRTSAESAPVNELIGIPQRRAALGQRRTAATVAAIRLLMDREPLQQPIFEAYAKERAKRQELLAKAQARVVKVFEDNQLDQHFMQGVVNTSCKAEDAAAKSLANPPAIYNRITMEEIAQLRATI